MNKMYTYIFFFQFFRDDQKRVLQFSFYVFKYINHNMSVGSLARATDWKRKKMKKRNCLMSPRRHARYRPRSGFEFFCFQSVSVFFFSLYEYFLPTVHARTQHVHVKINKLPATVVDGQFVAIHKIRDLNFKESPRQRRFFGNPTGWSDIENEKKKWRTRVRFYGVKKKCE